MEDSKIIKEKIENGEVQVKGNKRAKENKAKGKGKTEAKLEEPQTTFKGKVNAYGFIHVSKKLGKAWGITKGTKYPITMELTAEGNLLIRKT